MKLIKILKKFISDIVAIIPEKLYQKLTTINFNAFLENNALKAGVSLKFSKLSQSKHYYSQAAESLKIAKKLSIVLANFKEASFNILSDLITSKYDFIDFCHPAVLILMDFDRKNETNLLPTLQYYLENMASPMMMKNNSFSYISPPLYFQIDRHMQRMIWYHYIEEIPTI